MNKPYFHTPCTPSRESNWLPGTEPEVWRRSQPRTLPTPLGGPRLTESSDFCTDRSRMFQRLRRSEIVTFCQAGTAEQPRHGRGSGPQGFATIKPPPPIASELGILTFIPLIPFMRLSFSSLPFPLSFYDSYASSGHIILFILFIIAIPLHSFYPL